LPVALRAFNLTVPSRSRAARLPGSTGTTADQEALRTRQAELEDLLAAAPAADWSEAAEKARYLLGRFARSLDASDLRRRKLIDRVLADFDHLLDKATHD
jgi:hypothetical protein